MTAAMAMVQVPVGTAPAAPSVPTLYSDFAYEWKLGWEASAEPHATCPILSKHLMADIRRAAWKDGYLKGRKARGLTVRHMRPLQIIARRPQQDDEL